MAQRHLYERRRIRRIRHIHRRERPSGLVQRWGGGVLLGAIVAASGVLVAWRTHPLGLWRPLAVHAVHPVHRPEAITKPSPAASLPPSERLLAALPNGEVSHAALAVLLAARQHLALTSIGPRFVDVSAHFAAYTSVEAAADAGDFGQAPASHFDPTAPVTRAFLATTLVDALGLGQEASSVLRARPLTGLDLTGVPGADRGAFALVYTLGLMKPIHGAADPSLPATVTEVSSALADWPSLPSAALGAMLARDITSITLRVSPTTVWPGEPVSVSAQVHIGELTVPVRPTITVTGGTLAGGVFVPATGPHTARIAVTVPGSTIHVADAIHVVSASTVRILGPEPVYVLPGSSVTFDLGVVGQAGRPITIDDGRTLHVAVVGPTGVLDQTTLRDQAGQAHYTFTPTLLGTDHIEVSSPGLQGANLAFAVVPGTLGTVSLLTQSDTLSVGQGLSLDALWTALGQDPKLNRSIPLQLTATLTVPGQSTPQTVASWAVSLPRHAASASVALPSIPPVLKPGVLTVSLGAPGNAVQPSVITLPVVSPGSLRWVNPTDLQVGTPVHLTTRIVGAAAAGARPTLSLTAPDGGPLSAMGGAMAGPNLEFVFTPRESGIYRATVTLPGDGSVTGTLSVSPGPATRLEALLASPFLSPGQPLSFTPYAVDGTGQPVPGPVLHVRWRVLGGPPPSSHPATSPSAPTQATPATHGHTSAGGSQTSTPGQGQDSLFAWHETTVPSGQALRAGVLPAAAFTARGPRGIEVVIQAAGLPTVRRRIPWLPVTQRAALAEGTGVFLSYWVARDESAQSLVEKALAHHVHTLFIEVSVPGTGFWGQPGLDRLLPVAHAAGLSVLAWLPANLHHPSHDLAVARAALAYRTPLGQSVDGIAPDFEGNLSPAALSAYLVAVRKAAGPDRVIAAIEAAPPADAQVDPVLGRIADVLMPMDYWQMTEAPSNYQTAYEQVATSVQYLHLSSPAAVVPILQGYDPFSPGGAGLYNPGPLAEQGALRAAYVSGGAGAAFFQWGSLTSQEWRVVDDAGRCRTAGTD